MLVKDIEVVNNNILVAGNFQGKVRVKSDSWETYSNQRNLFMLSIDKDGIFNNFYTVKDSSFSTIDDIELFQDTSIIAQLWYSKKTTFSKGYYFPKADTFMIKELNFYTLSSGIALLKFSQNLSPICISPFIKSSSIYAKVKSKVNQTIICTLRTNDSFIIEGKKYNSNALDTSKLFILEFNQNLSLNNSTEIMRGKMLFFHDLSLLIFAFLKRSTLGR